MILLIGFDAPTRLSFQPSVPSRNISSIYSLWVIAPQGAEAAACSSVNLSAVTGMPLGSSYDLIHLLHFGIALGASTSSNALASRLVLCVGMLEFRRTGSIRRRSKWGSSVAL